MADKEKILKEKIIDVGKRLYNRKLLVAGSGNVSAKISGKEILITAAQTRLSDLSLSDIVEVNLESGVSRSGGKPSSELPLHRLVYKNFKSGFVVHCHPPLINGYFAVRETLKALTFETRFYLGDIPVVKQDTPTVTDPAAVIKALKLSNIVVLKNHGVIAIADDFNRALSLIEALEEAVKTAAAAEIFKKEAVTGPKIKRPEKSSGEKKEEYPMFSLGHIRKIVDLVNKDEFIAQKGRELDLSVELAVKLNDTGKVYKFTFDKGKIKDVSRDSGAPFVISAPAEIWREVFLGNIDPFVAVTQGKMNLEGQLGQLSKWYVPFSRLFEIFKEVKFK